MGTVKRLLQAAAAALALILPGSVSAQEIVTVLTVDGNASGPGGVVEAGDRFSVGQVIRTNGDTQMELRFDDGTLMAIGPNSQLTISDVLMQGNGTASRFAVSALAGSYRFISGDSPNQAYEIETETATIGIRGTEFDVFSDGQVTGVLLYNGRVEICLIETGKCWEFSGSCQPAFADTGRNTVRGLRPNEAAGALSSFIYSQDQRPLSEELQTTINSCNKYFRERSEPGGEGCQEGFFDEETGAFICFGNEFDFF